MKKIFKLTAITVSMLFASNLQAKNKDVVFKTNADVYKAIKSDLVKPDGRKAKASQQMLKKRFILVYFSAHWCPPCRKFTPLLVNWYNKDHKDYDVIFVSSDSNKDNMKKYMEETKMPWVGIKKKSESETLMNKKFKTGSGIPNLVLIEKGKVIASSYEKGKYVGTAHPYEFMKEILKKSKSKK